MRTPTNDTIASAYWNKAITYADSVLKSPKEKITVAILDSDFDIDHEAFDSNLFFKNSKEKINKIDDDGNGYVDDIYGWNFLGDTITGKGLTYTQMEKTRILRKYTQAQIDSLYQNKKVPYTYEEVKKSYDKTVAKLKKAIKKYEKTEYQYTKVMDTLQYTFKDSSITQIDLENFVTTDTIIRPCIEFALYFYKDDLPYDVYMKKLDFNKKALTICMNLEYDNRDLIGDNPEDITDNVYGSPYLGKNLNELLHGTNVTGVIVSAIKPLDTLKIRDNKSYPIRIMPITITGFGNYLDKDMHHAIRYAVDQGAKVINISQGKIFAIHPDFVNDAIQYAADHDVLIVTSAGNDNKDLDQKNVYPNDIDASREEIFDNLIMVGAIDKYVNKELKRYSSNYGKKNVDLFAPGVKINTTEPNNIYDTASGTSFAAPIVVAIASLIRSYYPKLTAKQVKQILLDSGTKYEIDVAVEQEDESTTLIPFSELSKSGAVVNAYQALLLARKIAERKKK